MVTDRLSTTGLCIVLAVLYSHQDSRFAVAFLAAVALDIGAHWAQMYSSLLVAASSHKDVASSSSPLLRLYYRNRLFMGALCIGAEVFYLSLYLLAFPDELQAAQPAVTALARASFAFWMLKQVTNVLQGQLAAQRLAAHDSKGRA